MNLQVREHHPSCMRPFDPSNTSYIHLPKRHYTLNSMNNLLFYDMERWMDNSVKWRCSEYLGWWHVHLHKSLSVGMVSIIMNALEWDIYKLYRLTLINTDIPFDSRKVALTGYLKQVIRMYVICRIIFSTTVLPHLFRIGTIFKKWHNSRGHLWTVSRQNHMLGVLQRSMFECLHFVIPNL